MACLVHHGHAAADVLPFAEPGVRPHYAPDRVVRILHASVRLSVQPEEATFEGEARLTLVRLPTYRGRFHVDLDDVTIDDVTDGEGRAVQWRHVDGRIEVRSPEPPAELVVRWHGGDPRRGLYFTGPTPAEPERAAMAWTQCQDEDGHFVFPCHDHPSSKHPWTLELEAPLGFTLLSNGERVDGGERGGRAWARFEQREPMPAYLVTFVAARLAVVEATWRDRSVRYLVPEGQQSDVERAFGRTPQMIEHFSERLGVDYPWPRYDQVVVHDFVFGGMENVACTTMTDVLLVDAKAELEWQPDGLVSHELAHQWFGNLVTCQDWSQGWLNESWATYLEAVWWEHSRDAAEATWYRWTTARGYHDEHARRYRRPIVSYDFREPIDLFDRHLYNKGSCVLWTLRHQLGDEAFWAGVELYLRRHAHSTVHTRHFQRALEDASGTNLDGFFQQWVYTAGHPSLEVTLGRSDDQVTVAVKQTQDAESSKAAWELTLRVVVVTTDGQEHTADLAVAERERTWVLPATGEVSHVRVDPGYRVLADLKLKGPDAWLEPLLKDACPVMAVRAGAALLDSDSRRGVEAVRQALSEHPFHGVRASLLSALAARRTDAVRALLIERLGQEQDPRVRRAIATALGEWRTEDAADALLALLDEELPTWQLHGAALLALGRTRDRRAAGAIRLHLDVDSWGDWVRQRALEALAETEDPAMLDEILEHAGTSDPDRTRGAAASALGRLGSVVDAPVRRHAVEHLVQMLSEPGFRAQLAAIAALGRIRDSAALPALDRVHRGAPDGRTRRSAFEAMARIRQGRTTEEGLSNLRDRMEQLASENATLRQRLDRLDRPE